MTKQQQDKAAFFQVYHGLKVRKWHQAEGISAAKIGCPSKYQVEGSYLSLRSVEQITDEELIEVSKRMLGIHYRGNKLSNNPVIRSKEHFRINLQGFEVTTITYAGYIYHETSGVDNHNSLTSLAVYDYLRSIGILLPFRQYSIPQLIEMGWAKMEEK